MTGAVALDFDVDSMGLGVATDLDRILQQLDHRLAALPRDIK